MSLMDEQQLISDAIEYVSEILGNNSGGHDTAHSLRVYKNALKISEIESGCNLTVVSLAAILHDVDDHKLFDHENNENARAFLNAHDISDELTDEICRVINPGCRPSGCIGRDRYRPYFCIWRSART